MKSCKEYFEYIEDQIEEFMNTISIKEIESNPELGFKMARLGSFLKSREISEVEEIDFTDFTVTDFLYGSSR